jgi:ferredoxin
VSEVRVNPIQCEAHGLCAELFPERISLDDWGYPIIDARPIPRALEAHAREAVAACPVLAPKLAQNPPPGQVTKTTSGRILKGS